MRIRLTKLFAFEMAHALPGYDGACRHLHGHSFHLEVTVVGTPLQREGHPKNGMVMDFKDLKTVVSRAFVEQFDHALALPATTPPAGGRGRPLRRRDTRCNKSYKNHKIGWR